jgi:hypothetical protein
MHSKYNTTLNTVPTTHKYGLTCDTCKYNFFDCLHWARHFWTTVTYDTVFNWRTPHTV